MPETKKLIVVLGAHRSGTSLCTAALESLGAQLCIEAHYANEENPQGFFEHPDIVSFNDRLLSHLGGVWDNPLFDGATALATVDITKWQDEARELLVNLFGKVKVAAIKDPRLCQVLGFWLPVFKAAGYAPEQVYFIHTLRDPVEVALSQRRRSLDNPSFYEMGKNLIEGASLWLSLTAQALEQSAELNTYYHDYLDLLSQPEKILGELAHFLEIEPEPERVQTFCKDFIDKSLHRSIADSEPLALLTNSFPQLIEFNSALAPLLQNSSSVDQTIDRALAIFHRPDTQAAMFHAMTPVFSRLSISCREGRLQSERNVALLESLRQQKNELTTTNEEMQDEHQAVLSPLRAELVNLEAGNAELQGQLSAQEAEINKVSEEHKATAQELAETTQQIQIEQVRLEGECAHMVEQVSLRDDKISLMETSLSWKLTSPLRKLSSRYLSTRQWSAGKWREFRLRAILVYHRLSLRHPRLAWIIRQILRPLFKLMNTLLSTSSKPTLPASEGLLTRMIYQQLEASGGYTPLITVIVPNYNHASYLTLRLDSIFSQSYQNFEVILLDDASSDDSAAILQTYHQRYPEKSTLIVNESNSGGVFHQWQKGLNLAKGEIIWIAESDDWCTENFLETLVPFFENEAIQLAYSRTVFMDGAGDEQIWSINEYLHDIDPQRWNHTIVETGHRIVAEAFALKNIIPNVSSALMRAPQSLEILKDPQWMKMRTCGDWMLYLHLLRGGMLAYSPAACNYYRIHGKNTSVGSHTEDAFYREHEWVAKTAQQYFDVDTDIFSRQKENLVAHWRETRKDFSQEVFDACYSLDRIAESSNSRAPNLLMASYAFCAGGGETFPIGLANIMKGKGYNITYLDCAQDTRNDGVRHNLRPDIPIVSDFTQLERIIEDFGIDIVHSHHAWVDSTILDLLPESSSCKTVVTLHGMYETINEYDLKPILPRLVARSACLIYVADKNLDALRKHKLLDKATMVRIDNALADDCFDTISRESLDIAPDAFVLTLVSRGMEEKGWVEAIEAVGLARESSAKDIQLLLVGNGPEYERLMGEDLPAYIHLEGFQRNVRGYFALANIGFLPSRFRGESFPLVIIECLQAGKPVLATDLGEIPYMLSSPQGDAGVLVKLVGDNIDIPVLAEKISELALNDLLYQLLQARVMTAAKKFDPVILAEKHDKAYRATVGGPI